MTLIGAALAAGIAHSNATIDTALDTALNRHDKPTPRAPWPIGDPIPLEISLMGPPFLCISWIMHLLATLTVKLNTQD
jgi:hypothetical protein